MRLKVNEQKTRVCLSRDLNFLGHGILGNGSLILSKSSESRLKKRIRQMTRRNRGVSFTQVLSELRNYCRGWLHYFSRSQMKTRISKLDAWIRRRLRCFRIKQCKQVKHMMTWLKSLGTADRLIRNAAKANLGWWRRSQQAGVRLTLNDEWFQQMGYYSLTANYKRLFQSMI